MSQIKTKYITNNAVTNAKLAQMAAATVKANTTGGTANASDVSLGTVTEATSAVLTLTGFTNATIGSPTIQVKQSSGSQSGYLSSTDWTTFNGKQTAGNYITALTGDVTAGGPGSAAATLATVNANIGTFASATVNAKGLVTAAANLSGDITTSGSVTTLATVNANTGSFGSSTAIPNFTVNGKGLITAAGTNVVIAPAGTLTGTTLASNVVSSSLTSVGTIATGVWNGTAVGTQYGGTGQNFSASTGAVVIAAGTASTVAPGTSGNVLTSNGTTWVSQAAGGGGGPNINARVHISSFTTITSGFTVMKLDVVDYDTNSAYNTSTGIYTIPTTGKYLVTAVLYTSATYTAGNFLIAGVFKNGTASSQFVNVIEATASNAAVIVTDTVSCTASDSLTVQALSQGGSPALVATPSRCYFTIQYIGT